MIVTQRIWLTQITKTQMKGKFILCIFFTYYFTSTKCLKILTMCHCFHVLLILWYCFSATSEMVSNSSSAGSGVSDSEGIYESDLEEMQKKWAEYKDGSALDRYSK